MWTILERELQTSAKFKSCFIGGCICFHFWDQSSFEPCRNCKLVSVSKITLASLFLRSVRASVKFKQHLRLFRGLRPVCVSVRRFGFQKQQALFDISTTVRIAALSHTSGIGPLSFQGTRSLKRSVSSTLFCSKLKTLFIMNPLPQEPGSGAHGSLVPPLTPEEEFLFTC